MIFLLAIGGALLGVTALVASRSATPVADQGSAAPPVQQQPPQSPPPQRLPPPKDGGAAGGLDLGGKSGAGILEAAGVAAGLLARESAFTNEAKDLSLPVGIGVAAAAYLAINVGGAAIVGVTGVAVAGAAAAGYVIAPVVLVTVAIITIVDGIARTIRVDEWKKLVKKVGELRAAGQFREAMALWVKKLPEFPAVTRVWPQPPNPALGFPGDDWYNPADPLGRPWAGFPVMPAPATAADVARWPELVPVSVFTDDGKEIPVRGLFEALQKDVTEIRAYGLANKVPGKAPGPKGLIVTTTGERDLRGWKPYDTALSNLTGWADAISAATPWLTRDALRGGLWMTPAERAVSKAVKDAATVKRTSTRITTIAARTGQTVAEVKADSAQATQEATTARAETAQARAGQTAPESTADAADRTSRTARTNTSGSGGRNA